MIAEIRRSYAHLEVGPLFLTLWWSAAMWNLSYHSASCCRFYMEAGPLEIGLVRRS